MSELWRIAQLVGVVVVREAVVAIAEWATRKPRSKRK